MRLLVVEHLSLDGVVQAPGGAEEDTRGGFRHGGWAAAALGDPEVQAAMGERMEDDFAWLLGRRTYDQLLGHWNAVGGPFRDGLNGVHTYVASSDRGTVLPWPRSELLSGDVPAAVADLRRRPGGSLVVMGSGELVRSLLPHGLVDELLLMVHPVVLGSGARLFGPADDVRGLRLVGSRSTGSGVVVATYRPVTEGSGEGRPGPAGDGVRDRVERG